MAGFANVKILIAAISIIPKMIVSIAPHVNAVLVVVGVIRLIGVPISEGSDGMSSCVPVIVSLVTQVSSCCPKRLAWH
jgi:hypothetical protein